MPTVFNKYHKNAPQDAVYIGRGSKWGNPYTHIKEGTKAQFVVGTREEAVAQYRSWLMSQPELMDMVKKELKGCDLVCFCKPKSCHGDVLLEVANDLVATQVVQITKEPSSKLKWKRN